MEKGTTIFELYALGKDNSNDPLRADEVFLLALCYGFCFGKGMTIDMYAFRHVKSTNTFIDDTSGCTQYESWDVLFRMGLKNVTNIVSKDFKSSVEKEIQKLVMIK